MKKDLARVFGIGVVMSLLVTAAALWSACQPGVLPCEQDPEWKALCEKKRPADGAATERADGGGG